MSKPSAVFESFKCYQELVGADDDTLKKMLHAGCSELPYGNFEDALTEVWIQYLNFVTGIPWIREYENGARPSNHGDGGGTTSPDGQYGTFFIMWADDEMHLPITSYGTKIIDGIEQRDVCESVRTLEKFTARLRVFRESGRANRGQNVIDMQAPARSAMDVLTWAKRRTNHEMMRAALWEYGIQMDTKPMSRVINGANLVNKTWERQATTNLEFFACTTSNLRTPVIAFDCKKVEIEVCDNPQAEALALEESKPTGDMKC